MITKRLCGYCERGEGVIDNKEPFDNDSHFPEAIDVSSQLGIVLGLSGSVVPMTLSNFPTFSEQPKNNPFRGAHWWARGGFQWVSPRTY